MRALVDLALSNGLFNSRKGSIYGLNGLSRLRVDFMLGSRAVFNFRCGILGLLIYFYNIKYLSIINQVFTKRK